MVLLSLLGALLRSSGRLRRVLRVGLARVALVGLAAPVVAYVSVGVGGAATALQTTRLASRPPVIAHHGVAAAPACWGTSVMRGATWNQLIEVERTLDVQQRALASQEARVRALVTQPGPAPAADTPATAVPSTDAVVAQALDLRQTTLAALQQSLQQEYEIYAGAAADPAKRAELIAVAAATRQPDAPTVVSFDLDAVGAQLSQDAAIAAAEAQLQAQPPAAAPAASASPAAASVPVAATAPASAPAPRPSAARPVLPGGRPALIAPLGGQLSQGFGPTDLPFEPPMSHDGVFYPHFHTGLDIAARLDTPVHAAADGTVILATASRDSAGRLVGYGNYVAIAHPGGLTTVYGHLDSVQVSAGQAVHQGDVIGLEGSTGNSTGPHLHFETRLSGGIVDPTPYLAAQIHTH